jgi:hypothetical protein
VRSPVNPATHSDCKGYIGNYADTRCCGPWSSRGGLVSGGLAVIGAHRSPLLFSLDAAKLSLSLGLVSVSSLSDLDRVSCVDYELLLTPFFELLSGDG